MTAQLGFSLLGTDYLSGAVVSPDECYRYQLWRTWDRNVAPVVFVMLNPSTADATDNDPTIVRCVNFAKAWRAGGIVVVNLFAFRTPYPASLMIARDRGVDIVGPGNDETLRIVFERYQSAPICAWGKPSQHRLRQWVAERADKLTSQYDLLGDRLDRPLRCLGTTVDGWPRHPLMLLANTKPQVWSRRPA